MTKIIIGKQGDQKFPIKNAGVSRQHASITIEGGHWILEDMDSTNGACGEAQLKRSRRPLQG